MKIGILKIDISLYAWALILALSGLLLFSSGTVMAQVDAEKDICENIQGGNYEDGICEPIEGTPSETSLFGTGSIFESIANALLFLVGAISVIMLIVGGFRYVVSAGDQNAVAGAKNTILYAVIGIIVAFLAYAAVRFVTNAL